MITGALDAYDTVIIDCAPAAHPWIDYADHRILVTRPCYLALHRAIQQPRPDHLVVITEAGRALTPTDIQTALGTPITATVPYDPDIARTLDAGLLTTRPPRALTRPLRPLLTATSRARSEVVA